MLEKIKSFMIGKISFGSFELPMWGLLAAVLGVVILLIVLICVLGKKRVSGNESAIASTIIKDIQTKKELKTKDLNPPDLMFNAYADLPNPECTAKPINEVYNELLGIKEEPKEAETAPVEDTIIPEPASAEEFINENNVESLQEEDSTNTIPMEVEEQPVENQIVEPVPVEDTPTEEVVPVVEETVEEVTFDNDVSEEVAQEEVISTDNIVEEVAQEEVIEAAPVEEIKVEEPIEEAPIEEPVIEEVAEEAVPVVEEEPAPIEEPVSEPTPVVEEEPIPEEPTPVEEPVPVEEEVETPASAFGITITPAVPVINPAKTKKAPLKKKATLVKAPVSRPKGSKPKKASDVKRTVAAEPKNETKETTISTYAPITKMDGDEKVLVIKLFGDKIEPSRGKYVVVKDPENLIKPYYFVLKANNGQVLFTSQGYKIHPRARQIETFRKALDNGTFNYVKTKSGEFTFKLMTAEGKLFGKGMDYPNMEGAEKACESVKNFAEKANYIEDAED